MCGEFKHTRFHLKTKSKEVEGFIRSRRIGKRVFTGQFIRILRKAMFVEAFQMYLFPFQGNRKASCDGER